MYRNLVILCAEALFGGEYDIVGGCVTEIALRGSVEHDLNNARFICNQLCVVYRSSRV